MSAPVLIVPPRKTRDGIIRLTSEWGTKIYSVGYIDLKQQLSTEEEGEDLQLCLVSIKNVVQFTFIETPTHYETPVSFLVSSPK